MIYYYSTLIQFVAAIYVTLSFDTWLFKSLWSMSYAKLINERVETLFKSSSSTIEQHLINNVANNATLIERRSRLRGFFCLLYCSATLWYVGYEQNSLPIGCSQFEVETFHVSFAAFTLLSIVGYVVVCIWATRLLHAFIVCVAWIAIFMILNIFDLSVCLGNPVILHIVRHLNLYCSVLVVLPLVYQIILTWLYSDNYYYILGANIRKEYEDYQKALNADDINVAPDSYKNAFGQAYFDSKKDNATDTIITKITDKFKEQLMEATKIPSQLELIKYAIIHSFGRRIDELKNIVVAPTIKGEELPQAVSDSNKQNLCNKSTPLKTTAKKSSKKTTRKTATTTRRR